MKKSLFAEEQIVRLLRWHENREATVEAICGEVGISQAIFYAWKKKCGGISISEARRLRELER